MESSGEKNKVHISGDVAKRLEKHGYKVTFRGTVPVKGKGICLKFIIMQGFSYSFNINRRNGDILA